MQNIFRTPVVAGVCLFLVATGALAQGVYRIVGPDGKVTFSDRAPADAKVPAAPTPSAGPAASPTGNSTLPYDLRQVAVRFPVTLYTGSECAPCSSVRSMLAARGVPFTERTVTSNEDIAALQRLSGGSTLPFGTIGGQQLIGYSDAEWAQYLDAAGYPKRSALPPNYRPPASTPLVAVKSLEAAPSSNPAATPATNTPRLPAPVAPVNSGPTPSNPAGIRF